MCVWAQEHFVVGNIAVKESCRKVCDGMRMACVCMHVACDGMRVACDGMCKTFVV